MFRYTAYNYRAQWFYEMVFRFFFYILYADTAQNNND